jgi:alpha-D-ribose 1-methylphosphonate 5-triphosphate synthase subunit PhnG
MILGICLMADTALDPVPALTAEQVARQKWLGVLAKATRAELEDAWSRIGADPEHGWLRQPEFGSVMIRGRVGGTGDQFNFGEATMTRCALRLSDGTAGYAYILGRDARRAQLAALIDALLQQKPLARKIASEVIAPLAEAQAKRREERSRRANSTKVEFFAMERGVSMTSQVQSMTNKDGDS